MNDPVVVARRRRGKGLRSRKAKARKAALTPCAAPASVVSARVGR